MFVLSQLILLSVAYGQPVDPFLEEETADLFRLEREVVTVASRYSQTLQEAPSIVSVITETDIRVMGYRNLTMFFVIYLECIFRYPKNLAR